MTVSLLKFLENWITASLSPVCLCGSALHWSQFNSKKQDAFQSRLCHATKMKKIRENQHRNRAENRQPEQDKSKNPGVFLQHPSTAFLIAVCLRSYNLISISPLGFQSLWTARDHGTCACTRPAADKKKCGNWAGLSSRTACSHLLIIRIQLKPNNSVWMRFEHNVLHPLKQTWDRMKREEVSFIYTKKSCFTVTASLQLDIQTHVWTYDRMNDKQTM